MNEKNNLQQALELQQSGALEQADTLYQHIAQQQDLPDLAKHQWCILKMRLQQYAAALDLIQQLLAENTNNPEYLVTKAKILENQQQFAAAETIYQKLIDAPQPYLPAYMHIANLYFHRNQTAQALDHYQRALQKHDHPEIRFNYALALAKDAQLELAQQQLQQVLWIECP